MKPSDSGAVEATVGHFRLAAAAVSECGPVRRENQDAFRLVELPGIGLGLVVADGMGGHSGGGEAAAAAVEAAAGGLSRPERDDGWLAWVIAAANQAVDGVRRRLGGNPGTTIEAALVGEGRISLAHVGDSRAYLLHAGVARPLTADHSLTAERIRAGTMAPEEARTDPRRNFVTRALLGDPVEPDLVDTVLAAGDTVLLCSDGLWASLSDPRIAELMDRADPRDAAHDLVSAALAAGSTDNVTAVVARLDVV
ncbi:MAG: protein phosphatase 2C domain-containing protein [Candidatus Dormiibacterota bacterium]